MARLPRHVRHHAVFTVTTPTMVATSNNNKRWREAGQKVCKVGGRRQHFTRAHVHVLVLEQSHRDLDQAQLPQFTAIQVRIAVEAGAGAEAEAALEVGKAVTQAQGITRSFVFLH